MEDMERLSRIIDLARKYGPVPEKDLQRIMALDEERGPLDDQTLLKLINMARETEAGWRDAKLQLISVVCILGAVCLLVLVIQGC